MIQLCRHLMPGGKICDQAAVRDTLFCRHHSTVKAALEREKAAPDPEVQHTPIAFVYPEDKAAIQLNLFLVMEALNHRRIDNPTANTLIRALRTCEQNMRKGALGEANREKVAKTVVTLPDGEEVGMPREAREVLDDPEAEHGLGCLCAKCDEKLKKMPKERHDAACRCGACEPAMGTTDERVREATVVELHNVPPEAYEWKNAPGWIALEPQGSAYQDMMIEQHHQRKAREQQRREKAAMEALASGYEASVDGAVQWKKGMKEALLEDFKQAMADGRPYEPQAVAAGAA